MKNHCSRYTDIKQKKTIINESIAPKFASKCLSGTRPSIGTTLKEPKGSGHRVDTTQAKHVKAGHLHFLATVHHFGSFD